jgi:hypothetical protein
MHGIVPAEFKFYVETQHSSIAWSTLLAEAGLTAKPYVPFERYPDAEVLALIGAAARLTRRSSDDLLQDFGRFLAPTLLKTYGFLVEPHWKTMDLLLHTESNIHRTVRSRDPNADPPRLHFERTGPNTLVLHYNSPRRLSALARGIIQGVASHYRERVTIDETTKADGGSTLAIAIDRML